MGGAAEWWRDAFESGATQWLLLERKPPSAGPSSIFSAARINGVG
jgi:hypothetical protein